MAITQEIDEAVQRAAEALQVHPERDHRLVERSTMENRPRRWPVLRLGRQPDPDAGEGLVRKAPPPRDAEQRLLDKVRGLAGGLAMHNPITPRIGLGRGTGSLAASFGITLDAELAWSPRGCRDIDAVIAEGIPDPETAGLAPEMREDVETARALTPDWIEIGLPDMQGPFNIAHTILGDNVFLAPLLEPEKFREFMTILTDYFIALHRTLCRWIGPARLPRFPAQTHRIAECSVNMISPDTYVEHVLPHDRRIAEYYGQVAVHPCSGPHVFHATLDHLPKIVYHEAGFIAKTAAGAIGVDEALDAIGDRPIILSIGQELPEGDEEAFIRRDLDRARANNRLTFGYTGMHWKKRDESKIRDLHLRLDDYWDEHVAARS